MNSLAPPPLSGSQEANEFQQVRTKLGGEQVECNLAGSQTCLHCRLISQPTACPFLRPQLITSLFVPHQPPASSAPLNMDRSLLYMWHTGWQKVCCKKSHSSAAFCAAINSKNFSSCPTSNSKRRHTWIDISGEILFTVCICISSIVRLMAQGVRGGWVEPG